MQVIQRFNRSHRFLAALCAFIVMVAVPSIASARAFDEPSAAPAPSVPSITTGSGGDTLAIALAGAALLSAIVGGGYIAIRLRAPRPRTVGR